MVTKMLRGEDSRITAREQRNQGEGVGERGTKVGNKYGAE